MNKYIFLTIIASNCLLNAMVPSQSQESICALVRRSASMTALPVSPAISEEFSNDSNEAGTSPKRARMMSEAECYEHLMASGSSSSSVVVAVKTTSFVPLTVHTLTSRRACALVPRLQAELTQEAREALTQEVLDPVDQLFAAVAAEDVTLIETLVQAHPVLKALIDSDPYVD